MSWEAILGKIWERLASELALPWLLVGWVLWRLGQSLRKEKNLSLNLSLGKKRILLLEVGDEDSNSEAKLIEKSISHISDINKENHTRLEKEKIHLIKELGSLKIISLM
jgi:hypothetical protein